ncbi:MAG: hypothetical protein GTO29_08925 [Candidatus Latescibacteria bacterium]|nr:hypothetical protein [Candidatus Latescibacterota bacterium]NIO56286.1 hypothetical protein [Candidatus Latescibacterota bacterium]
MAEPGKRFEKYQDYISSQIKRAEKEGRPAKPNPAITISRETGAGAIPLGDRLAEYLNERFGSAECQWTVFDKNLVKQVLEDHGLPERLEQFMQEDKPSLLDETVSDMLGIRPPDWELVKHTHETIYRLAKLGNCILVGRGANIITQELPNVLHLRLVGSWEKRVNRCMELYGITKAEARELIKKQDRARRRYMLAYYDTDIDDPANYHLIINVDRFTTEALVQLIGDMISNWSK